MKINVRNTLEFFDERPAGSKGHATGIMSLIGEDLGVGLLKHYLESQDAQVHILNERPRSGSVDDSVRAQFPNTKVRPELDYWVDVVRPNGSATLFQVEVKSWAAWAIGGRVLNVDASPDSARAFRQERWKWYGWEQVRPGASLRGPIWSAVKVLVPMRRPSGVAHPVEPLVSYWVALHPAGDDECLFPHKLPDGLPFSQVWVFSQSAYLRSLNLDELEVDTPNVSARVAWLRRISPSMFIQ